ncbi:MAG: cupin domain-containing protein [Dehalococcoidia bacterium]|nr:cupin domain-containing protein [Dehalococcoidia bacterium]
MSELNREIGERIKGVRGLSELSCEEFAKRVGTTPELLVQYEEGEAEIPVSFLHDVSHRFDISMTELLSGESAKLSVYSVVRKGKGLGISRRQAYDYQSLAYNFADRLIDPFYITVEPKPKDDEASLVCHVGQEFHYVLEGVVRMTIAKYETTLHEGDSIYFDSTYPHGMEAVGGKPARLLVVITGRE